MDRTAIIPMMNLSEASQWLSERTGKSYSVRDVMYLIEGIAYAVAPEGAFNAAKSRNPECGPGPCFRDDLFKLSLDQLDGLRVRRFARINSYKAKYKHLGTGTDGESEFSTNFKITLDDVRVRESDVESLANSQRVGDVATLAETPTDAPRPKKGRPADVDKKQKVVLVIAEAFAAVINDGDDKKLPPTKADFLDACRRLEVSLTSQAHIFKRDLTADTVADWLRPSGYQFKHGTPTRGKIYTSNLPKIAGKIKKELFTLFV